LFRCFCKDPSSDLTRPGFTRAGFPTFPGERAELAQLPRSFQTAGRSPANKKKRRCLKPPFAAPPKETGTGQRVALCAGATILKRNHFTPIAGGRRRNGGSARLR
jgi:hypothetical protein